MAPGDRPIEIVDGGKVIQGILADDLPQVAECVENSDATAEQVAECSDFRCVDVE